LPFILVLILSFIRQRVDVVFKISPIVEALAAQHTTGKLQLAELRGTDPEICCGSRLGQEAWEEDGLAHFPAPFFNVE
jgi:hypothetical protein